MNDIELIAKQRVVARLGELLARNDADPEDWPDAEKLRLLACLLDKRDHDRGVYDKDEVQVDLRRIADRIETLDAAADEWLCWYPESNDDACMVDHKPANTRMPRKHTECGWHLVIPKAPQ